MAEPKALDSGRSITAAERRFLEDVADGPRPGGYDVDLETLVAVTKRGLVKVDAVLTPAGREALR